MTMVKRTVLLAPPTITKEELARERADQRAEMILLETSVVTHLLRLSDACREEVRQIQHGEDYIPRVFGELQNTWQVIAAITSLYNFKNK